MPRIAPALAVFFTVVTCIGYNTARYPVVWEMVAGSGLPQPRQSEASTSAPQSTSAAGPLEISHAGAAAQWQPTDDPQAGDSRETASSVDEPLSAPSYTGSSFPQTDVEGSTSYTYSGASYATENPSREEFSSTERRASPGEAWDEPGHDDELLGRAAMRDRSPPAAWETGPGGGETFIDPVAPMTGSGPGTAASGDPVGSRAATEWPEHDSRISEGGSVSEEDGVSEGDSPIFAARESGQSPAREEALGESKVRAGDAIEIPTSARYASYAAGTPAASGEPATDSVGRLPGQPVTQSEAETVEAPLVPIAPAETDAAETGGTPSGITGDGSPGTSVPAQETGRPEGVSGVISLPPVDQVTTLPKSGNPSSGTQPASGLYPSAGAE